MKVILGAVLIYASVSRAAESSCGRFDVNWNLCKTSSDCLLVADVCGSVRIPTNKVHKSEAEKFFVCNRGKEQCPGGLPGTTSSPLKCEAYTVSSSKVKTRKPRCTLLSDIVGMAINNNDRARIEAAITETKDVDMPLSHIHETPLSLAAMNAKTELVAWLLSKGAKINFQTTNGYTALMFAALSHSSDKENIKKTIALLLKAGADKSLRNDRGENAMDQAVLSQNEDAAKLLK